MIKLKKTYDPETDSESSLRKGTKNIINFRVTAKERTLLKSRARAKGLTLSGFIIKKCLSNALWVEDKIDEIHQVICRKKGE